MPSPKPETAGRTGLAAACLAALAAAAAAVAITVVPASIRTVSVTLAAGAAVVAAAPWLLRWASAPQRRNATEAEERLTSSRRAVHELRTRRSARHELDRGLDNARDEEAAIALIREALARELPDRTTELHLVDPIDPVLALAAWTGPREPRPADRTSPWDALAARSDRTLVYESTERLDVCTHLRRRVDEPSAALATPLNVLGRLLGVLYVFAPDGHRFESDEIDQVEDLSAVIGSRLALIRSAASDRRPDALDRLTGLPDRAAMQARVIRLLEERRAFTVAVADIDDFTALNEQFGRDAGDRALQSVARVARRAIRPDDLVGRIGGDELLFVLPRTTPDNATRALERLREELVLAQSSSDEPPFTLSVGVIGSTSGRTIEEMLQRAAGALNHAKDQGGNRVVVAQPTKHS